MHPIVTKVMAVCAVVAAATATLHTSLRADTRPSIACTATAHSLTPDRFRPTLASTPGAVRTGLRLVREIPLPGPPNRFDYQSFDPTTNRLYINHMDAGETLVLATDGDSLVARIGDVPRATGVLVVPALHRLFISAAGAHMLVTVDTRTLHVLHRTAGIRFPDGIAYDADVGKIFVSDESGSSDVVMDAVSGSVRSTIPLGGEAGNTHFDSVSHCILVAVQTRNELVAIDPVTERIVQRYTLAGADHPHGFTMDQQGRLLFMSCEGNAGLLVIDLRSMRIVETHPVGDGPDVLAWDAGWRRLYVASEGGVLSMFRANGNHLVPVGEYRAPHAHTVGLDTRTHRVYLPLENVGGHAVLRILEP